MLRVAPHAGAWIEISDWSAASCLRSSRPTRARGLKFRKSPKWREDKVAPHAGAWIEICRFPRSHDRRAVAPHAGAWIEMRRNWKSYQSESVAPHAGAWIEMGADPLREGCYPRSRPTRARGLKFEEPILIRPIRRSRPTRARGLKSCMAGRKVKVHSRAPRGRVD